MNDPIPPTSTAGYHGRYRRIDVTSGAWHDVTITERALRHFIGGSGLGTYLLLREGTATVDALAPEAAIAFVFSPLVGSPLTTSAKIAVVSKSPLTDRLNDSLASSTFAMAGNKSGCDAIVIVGRAATPSILVIDDNHVSLQQRSPWGQRRLTVFKPSRPLDISATRNV